MHDVIILMLSAIAYLCVGMVIATVIYKDDFEEEFWVIPLTILWPLFIMAVLLFSPVLIVHQLTLRVMEKMK